MTTLRILQCWVSLIVTPENEGRSGGQYYEYEFSVDLDLVANVVSDFKRTRSAAPRRTIDPVSRVI